MEKIDSKNIRQLLSDPDLTIEELLDREDFANDVRNISSQFTYILNYQNIKKVIDWLIKAGPENDPRSYKFPLVAGELMTMQTPNINEFLFAPEDDKQPLFEYLFKFTEFEEDYTLVGYFSKVMIAIIKRHSSIQSKYNDLLCEYLFEKQYLFKLINHLYSTSTVDLIIRIFTVKSKSADYYQKKKEFVIQVLRMMEDNKLSDQITQNVFFFIEAVLLNETNNTTPNSFKSNIQAPNNYEIRPLAFEEQVLDIMFKSVGVTDRIRKTKAKIVNLYLYKYRSMETYAKHEDKIVNYLKKMIKYLKQKAESGQSISLGQVFLLDNMEALLHSPIQSINYAIANSLGALFKLINNSNWNNIFHQQVEKIIKQLFCRAIDERTIQSLFENVIQFEVKNRGPKENVHQYQQFIVKIGAQLVRLVNKNMRNLDSYHIEFIREIEEIIQNQQNYLVGDSFSLPRVIQFAYSKQAVVKQYFSFLTSQTIIIYQQTDKKQKLLTKNSKRESATIETNVSQQTKALPLTSQEEYFFVQPQLIIPTLISEDDLSKTFDLSSFKKHRIHYQLSQLMGDLGV